MLVGCVNEEEIMRVYKQLKKHFDINCLGEARQFLGLEITKDPEGIYSLSLHSHIKRVIETFGMKDAKVTRTPMDRGYMKNESKSEAMKDITMYRSLVGALMYIAVCARPDIAVSVAILGREFSTPCVKDWIAAKRVLRHLKGTADWKLRLGGLNKGDLEAFSDSDWAGDPTTRKSTTGFVVFFAGGAVSWASRRQSCVSLSSMEAEYVALGETCQEVIWLRHLLEDLGEKQKKATIIHEDNQGCLTFVQLEKTSRRSKHIDTKKCFIRDLCEREVIKLEYCPSEMMRADIFTKPLGCVKHQNFTTLIGLQSSRGETAEEE
ncbi:uncharacterized protein LOC131429072 [Malaya genurostris]|uniref:uncharacterized protein LOC131429072 n=1 Tax=Malaya genurostris TaxID=325434 RepID=UPI0026F3E5BE|nr:uncharacterized protein LOC131429072 [Malaya genurostris]